MDLKLPTISEHSKETFYLEFVFPEVKNCGLQVYNVGKKVKTCKDFSGVFKLFEQLFLSEYFPKFICSGVFSSVVAVDCIWYSYFKGTQQRTFLLDIFQFYFGAVVSKHPMKSSVTEFSRFLGSRL